jgi:hypothetical protein
LRHGLAANGAEAGLGGPEGVEGGHSATAKTSSGRSIIRA